jgi:hypothetical protein
LLAKSRRTLAIMSRMRSQSFSMMVWWKIGAGTHVTAHSHPHEQLVWIVKGTQTDAMFVDLRKHLTNVAQHGISGWPRF